MKMTPQLHYQSYINQKLAFMAYAALKKVTIILTSQSLTGRRLQYSVVQQCKHLHV